MFAEVFYGAVPDAIAQQALSRLDDPLHKVTLAFCEKCTQAYQQPEKTR
jgi:hypothetical protein